MKTRIKGDIIRFRLSQSEVEQLAEGGTVSSHTVFTRATALNFILRGSADVAKIIFQKKEDTYLFDIPKNLLKVWKAPDQVTIEEKIDNGKESGLTVLIEKDFQCLIVRKGEDESGLFPNPSSERRQ